MITLVMITRNEGDILLLMCSVISSTTATYAD